MEQSGRYAIRTVTSVSRRRPPAGRSRLRSLLAAVAFAVTGAGVATGLGLAIGLEGRPGSAVLYVIGVVFAAYLGGLWSGLGAAALSLFALEYFFIVPYHEFGFDRSALVSLGVLVGASVLVVALLERERRAYRALQEAEHRLELTLEETATGFWAWNHAEDEFLWSPNLGPMFGLPRGTSPGSSAEFESLVHPDDLARVAAGQRQALAGDDHDELEFRIVTPQGETRWLWSEATVDHDAEGAPLRLLGITRDVTPRKRRELADRFLTEASELLGRSLELDQTLTDLADLAVPSVSDWCAIELRGSNRRASTTVAAPRGAARLEQEILDARLGAFPGDDAERAQLRTVGSHSIIVAPIAGQGESLGVLTLASTEPRRPFDEIDLDLAQELARRLGSAIVNAHLHAAEREARDAAEAAADRTARLQRVSAALAGVTTSEELAAVLVTLGTPAIHHSALWVAYSSGDGSSLVPGAEGGLPPEVVGRSTVPNKDGLRPIIDVARAGRAVWLSSAELGSTDPEIAAAYRKTGLGAIGAVPIPVADGTAGVILVSRSVPEPFAAIDRAFLLALGAQAGQAVERVRAHDAEAELRKGIEHVLDIAPSWLSGSPEDVARAICRTGIDTFGAPVCHLFDVHGTILRLAGREPASDDRPRGYEIPIDDFPGLREALVDTRSMFVPDVQGVHHHAIRGDALAHARATGLRSSLRIPVSIAGTAERVMVLSWHEVVEQPRPARLAVIRRFADQAALALEQAERKVAEEHAARSAERVRRLQEITASLSKSASIQEIARTVLDHARALGGRAGAVALVREPEQTMEVIEAVGYPREVVERLRRFSLEDPLPLAAAARKGETVIVPALSERDGRVPGAPGSVIAIPLNVGHRTIGALSLHLAGPSNLTADDRALLLSLARLSAQAIERAQLYEREQVVAATLQRSVLPDAVPRLEAALVATRYLPGSAGLDVGGDWYDVVRLGDRQAALAVGDVVGKGVSAASTMAQLRNALRAYVLEGFGPAAVVSRLNRIAEITDLHFATLFVAIVDLRSGECRFTSAGHPPGLIVSSEREAVYLEGGASLPLGVSTEAEYEQAVVVLEPGSTLVLYTDGLVERRTEDLGRELERLRQTAAEGPKALELLVDHVVDTMFEEDARVDDVALLALRLLEEPFAGFSLSLPAAHDSLVEARTAVLAWLEMTGCDRALAHDICLACWEACANAIEHATDRRRPTIEITGELAGETIALTIRDHGSWREARPMRDRGLGLRLISGLSDELSIKPAPDGTRVTVAWQLRSAVSA